MKKFMGRVRLVANGQELLKETGATLDPGGPERTVVSAGNVIGYSEGDDKPAVIEAKQIIDADFSIDGLFNATDLTAVFESDIGKSWVVRNAVVVKRPSLTEGEKGTADLRIEGDPAEEVSTG